jgi:hypothetical protein
MSKALRLSEKWFRRGLWLVAFVFASFLIGLGGAVVGDLPQVEHTYSLEDFIDKPAAAQARAAVKAGEQAEEVADTALEQANLKLQTAQSNAMSARETFDNWLATRQATGRTDQDAELLSRTKALDALKAAERTAETQIEQLEQRALDARQSVQAARKQLNTLEESAQVGWTAAQREQELRVFGYRLALTLPLLLAAAWLFVKKRKSTYWPFVWGFIYFALFAFFVELVPYMPSYGGYVRYVVGIVLTVLVGRYAIIGLNRYLERQKLVEAMPNAVRREELPYDVALTRLSKNVCPGCERAVDLKNTEIDFCPHCGIGLFDHCRACQMRKSAFSKFCHGCGTAAQVHDRGEAENGSAGLPLPAAPSAAAS